jgi:hypothetical protein
MKKVQAMDEAGRAMAQKRYGNIPNKSQHGHSRIDHNMAGKFDDGGAVGNSPLQNQQAAVGANANALGQVSTETPADRANQIDPQTGKPYGGR